MKSGRRIGTRMLMVTLAVGCMVLVLMGPQWRDELRAQETAGPACVCDCDPGNRTIIICGQYTREECIEKEGQTHNRGRRTACILQTGTCNNGTDEDCPPQTVIVSIGML
jgi:hypothetical protein